MSRPTKLLIDTNVWVDYFVDRGAQHTAAMQLILDASARGDVALYAASVSLKDAFYLVSLESKRSLCADGLPITKEREAAIREAAWASVRALMDFALVVPVGQAEALQAMAYRTVHGDFEDDLILAAAKRVEADYVITSDEELLRHASVGCLTVQDGLALLRSKHS